MQTFKKILVLIFIGLSFMAVADETPWPVPEDQESKTAPAMFSEEMQSMGEEIYMKNCKSCHGDVGKNNMIPLNPLPKDLATIGAQTDGSIYYKINEGRGAMPTFKSTLSIADKWNVIAYIRSFHEDYVQPKPVEAVVFGGSAVTLALEYLVDSKQFKVLAVGKKDDIESPAEGVEVSLFAKRYFGDLKLGDNKSTNKEGIALFEVPKDLPGDKDGTLSVLVKVSDPDKYGEVSAAAEVMAGVPTDVPGITEERAMWNVRSMAPWWITFAYPLAVLAVLATLGYIALLLKKVYDLGKNESE